MATSLHDRCVRLVLAGGMILLQTNCGRPGATLADGSVAFDGNDADAAMGDAPPDSLLQCQGSGTLDPTFGMNGVAAPIFGLGVGRRAGASSVLIDGGGRIVVAGSVDTGNVSDRPRDCVVVRMLPDGTLDPTFGINGVARNGVSNHSCWHADIAFQADGKLVAVGGLVGPGDTSRVSLMRYLDDGRLDPTFGDMGMVLSEPAPKANGVAVKIDSANRIVVAAAGADGFDLGDESYFVTARYLPDGAIDSAFGTGGIAEAAFDNGGDLTYDLAIQSDDQIVVSGTAASTAMGQFAFGVVRYNIDGTRDMSFGATGLTTVPFDGGAAGGLIALDPSSRVVVVGLGRNGATSLGLITRIDAYGAVDTSFGVVGKVIESLAPENLNFSNVVVSRQQQLLSVGWSTLAGVGIVRLARYDDDGTIDSTFGTHGFAQSPSALPWYAGRDLAEQADSRIVVVGWAGTKNPESFDFFIARYCP